MPTRSIIAALAAGLDATTAVNREILTAHVQQAISCPLSGSVLDARTAVLFTIEINGRKHTTVVTGAKFDEIRPGLDEDLAQLAELGISAAFTEIFDGRGLFAGS